MSDDSDDDLTADAEEEIEKLSADGRSAREEDDEDGEFVDGNEDEDLNDDDNEDDDELDDVDDGDDEIMDHSEGDDEDDVNSSSKSDTQRTKRITKKKLIDADGGSSNAASGEAALAKPVRKAKSAFMFFQGDQLSIIRAELGAGVSMGDAMTEVRTILPENALLFPC